MKKFIIVLFFLSFIFVSNNQTDLVELPKDSIRFRIIANSDSISDQTTKIELKDQIEKQVFKNFTSTNYYDYRNEIKRSIPKIEQILDESQVAYQINYGNNYFPLKEYKGLTYDAGSYESLVITLGEGSGHNWWCVLYPPLCLIDENQDDIEYKSLVKDIIAKYL